MEFRRAISPVRKFASEPQVSNFEFYISPHRPSALNPGSLRL